MVSESDTDCTYSMDLLLGENKTDWSQRVLHIYFLLLQILVIVMEDPLQYKMNMKILRYCSYNRQELKQSR